jgi:hypothetical protein
LCTSLWPFATLFRCLQIYISSTFHVSQLLEVRAHRQHSFFLLRQFARSTAFLELKLCTLLLSPGSRPICPSIRPQDSTALRKVRLSLLFFSPSVVCHLPQICYGRRRSSLPMVESDSKHPQRMWRHFSSCRYVRIRNTHGGKCYIGAAHHHRTVHS